MLIKTLTYAGLLLALFLLVACAKEEVLPVAAGDGPATFVGSASCQTCHEMEYQEWMGSHHELAMQVATADTVLGNFDDASLEYFGTSTRFYTRDDNFFVNTADENGEQREYQITFVFGVEPLQQYLIEFPGGRLQTLAFSWDSRPEPEGGQRWFHIYGDEYIAPDDILHWTGLQQNWNYMCAECHSTDLRMGFDAASDTFTTTYSEISVGCEACHGPGSKHAWNAMAGNADDGYGQVADLDDHGQTSWIMNPETGIAARSKTRVQPQRQPEACGRCHSRRGIIAPEYEYGEPLAHTHAPALLDEGLYHADGQILDEVYVYGSFLQSRMYQAGVTCTDCHNPHTAELKNGSNPNDACAQCHLPTTFAATEHAGHEQEQAGCVDCHMTSEIYMGVDARRDHSFRIPRPDIADAVGSPSACRDCHADRDAAWASAAITQWRGSDAGEPRAHFAAAFQSSRHGFANMELLDVVENHEIPGIARATALSRLAQPFGRREIRTLERELGSPNPQLRIAALRHLRSFPPEMRLRLPGAQLLSDPVRGVRIEAASTYAGMTDLLPPEAARTWPQAETELRNAYESMANRPEALVALAAFETARRDVTRAINLLEQALQIEPRAANARANLADARRRLGEETVAEELLRDGIALDNSHAALHHALGLSLVRSGDADEALAELRQAAELAPDNPRFVYVLGIALNSLGQQAQAISVLLDARNRFDGDFEIAMTLATVLRDSGDHDAALDIAYTLARRHPEDQNVVALLRSLQAIP